MPMEKIALEGDPREATSAARVVRERALELITDAVPTDRGNRRPTSTTLET
jgi:hypothetical protein